MRKSAKQYLVFGVILIVTACTSGKDESEVAPESLFAEPTKVLLNTEQGYVINSFSGDTIEPILTSAGDTVQTGVALPLKGTTVYPDSILEQITKLPQPPIESEAAYPKQFVPQNLRTRVWVKDSLRTSENQQAPETYFPTNAIGDTLVTGEAQPATPLNKQCPWPTLTEAFQPRLKEGAKMNIQYLDLEQGMISSNVVSTFQDSYGYIWIATYSGISRYDGRSFLHFNELEELGGYTFSILEDSKKNMWFGTNEHGAMRLNTKTGELSVFNADGNFLGNSVRVITEDREGHIWFGTSGGASRYNQETGMITHYTTNEGLSDNRIPAIVEDKKGQIWFSTWEKGVTIYNPGTGIYTYLDESDGLSSKIVNSISFDHQNNVWLGTHYGATKIDPEKMSATIFRTEDGLSAYNVRSIVEDERGKIWIGSSEGIDIYDPEKNKFTYCSKAEGLSSNIITSLKEDHSGNMWIGTYGGGACVYPTNKEFTYLTESDGMSSDYAYYTLSDNNGNLWFSTNKGVTQYNRQTGKFFKLNRPDHGLADNTFRSIFQDKSGKMWFGSWSAGVSIYDPVAGTVKVINNKNGLVYNSVVDILEDKSGNIWLSTLGGVAKYNLETGALTNYTDQDGLSDNTTYVIREDADGNIWLASHGGGLSKIDPVAGTILHYSEREGLSHNDINSFIFSNDGLIWLGTQGAGANSLNLATGEIFYYGKAQGLEAENVQSVLEDAEGNLWFGTETGLNYLEWMGQGANEDKKSSQSFRITSIVNQDGLNGTDFFTAHPFADDQNQIWWGTNKCMTRLNLNTLKISDTVPQPHLSQLEINGNRIDYRSANDSVKNLIHFSGVTDAENYPIDLELPYNQNHLTFHFIALDWSAPHKIQYQYMLKGLDEKWSPVSDENFADYRNLPHGTFTFAVRAVGQSQEWSKNFEYTFTILPPWWLTWWAKTGYVLISVFLIFGLVKWRTAQLRKRQRELEVQIELATREIRDQKELIEEKHKEITDSINYAERIQRTFLAADELLNKHMKDYFVLFQPKEVVSGDFYWAGILNNGNFAWTVADSTGHGVPGAIMSIVNISGLEKSIETETKPDAILNRTREIIIDRLKRDGSPEGGKDGMDCALLVINNQRNQLTVAAGHNPVWIVRDEELIELRPDKMPVGKHANDKVPFTSQVIELQKGDVIYALTDGIADQFGGPKGKKFMQKTLKSLLTQIAREPMESQKNTILQSLNSWKGELEQVDDICIMGVRV